MISIDPDRDTSEVLAEYTKLMHPEMVGLTGSAEQVKAASLAYKTYYRKQDNGDAFYEMDHSTFTYLVFPDTGFAEYYRRDVSAEQMARSVACFVKHSG